MWYNICGLRGFMGKSIDNIFEHILGNKEYHMPDGIKTINPNFFVNCEFSVVHLPDSLETIEDHTFSNNKKVTRVITSNNLKSIGKYSFEKCKNLRSIILKNNLTEIGANAFDACFNLNSVHFPSSLRVIEDNAFHNTAIRNKISIPKLEKLGESAFSGSKISSVHIPASIKTIGQHPFLYCSDLKSATIEEGIKEISKGMFSHCTQLQHVSLPSTLQKIPSSAFSNCESLQTISLPDNLTSIDSHAFDWCISLKNLKIPRSVESIGDFAFTYTNMNTLQVYPTKNIGMYALFDCKNFHYLYINKKDGKLTFSKHAINNILFHSQHQTISLDYYLKFIPQLDLGQLIKDGNLGIFYDIVNHLKKNKISIQYQLFSRLNDAGLLDKVGTDITFSYIVKAIPNFAETLSSLPREEQEDLIKFANNLGCFSTEKLKDHQGKDTNTPFAQKACSVLSAILDSGLISHFHDYFNSMPYIFTPNQDFLQFIGRKDNNILIHVKMLLEMEVHHMPRIFSDVMTKFDQLKKLRNTVNHSGAPTTISWKQAIIKMRKIPTYRGTNPSNQDLADTFSKRDIPEYYFHMADALRERAHTMGINSHILNQPLQEPSILDQIKELQEGTSHILSDCQHQLDELRQKEFSYEMLNKYDARNPILGIDCNCCGTITSTFYGSDIAKATMTSNNVQNLVVNNSNNEIIAKGTMYINREKGYIVFNDFELNKKYKNHEIRGYPGIYDVQPSHPEEIQRNKIFNTFMRGINDFINIYNSKHPNNPIRQVNIGMGFNRLKRQCEQYSKAINLLEVPREYSFVDASQEQRVLYLRPQEDQMEN